MASGPAYAAYLETSSPWQQTAGVLEGTTKVAIVQAGSIVVSDTEFVDSLELQRLLKDQWFRNFLFGERKPIRVSRRAGTFSEVIDQMLDIRREHPAPMYFSSLSENQNRDLRKLHAKQDRPYGVDSTEQVSKTLHEHLKSIIELEEAGHLKPLTMHQPDLSRTFPKAFYDATESCAEAGDAPVNRVASAVRDRITPDDVSSRTEIRWDEQGLRSSLDVEPKEAERVLEGLARYAYHLNYYDGLELELAYVGSEATAWVEGSVMPREVVVAETIEDEFAASQLASLPWNDVTRLIDDGAVRDSIAGLHRARSRGDVQEAVVAWKESILARWHDLAVEGAHGQAPPRVPSLVTTLKKTGLGFAATALILWAMSGGNSGGVDLAGPLAGGIATGIASQASARIERAKVEEQKSSFFSVLATGLE